MIVGCLNIEEFLRAQHGLVTGEVCTDAKMRRYAATYDFEVEGELVHVARRSMRGEAARRVTLPRRLDLDEALVAFFGLYSGDGSKGAEDPKNAGQIRPNVSFSQRERHLVRFAVDQFRRVFLSGVKFTFSLGEDSAYFLAGVGENRLREYYRNIGLDDIPPAADLAAVRPRLDKQDEMYLRERRPDATWTNERYLAFYYQHKAAMEDVLRAEKESELEKVGIFGSDELVSTASLRRPFKKGARLHGGSSRSDELHLGGVAGMGELFLKMLHEIEDSVLRDDKYSSQRLVVWNDRPSVTGAAVDTLEFFQSDPWGEIGGERPEVQASSSLDWTGKWPRARSSELTLRRTIRLSPLWCYVCGLYLAEGTTNKSTLFSMYRARAEKLGLGFTSSEGASLELVLRALGQLFLVDDCLSGWKVKVGSQYFPELVVAGLKLGVPMLRGGNSGDGKLRTMEISLAIKDWALAVADDPMGDGNSILHRHYSARYSHVEPTGAGVARIDFWASATLCRWYFPLLMKTVFGEIVANPAKGFY